MADIEIKRGYEVLPDNNIRFGIRITNISDVVISDVEVILDYSESLFKLEGERVQKVGVIPPASTRTAEFILKPLGCVHKVNIEALISYRDTKYARQRIDMHPKEVHCVCPFLKGKAMPRAEFLELSSSGHSAESGLNFKGVSVERLASYLVQTCKSRHHKVDDYSVDGGRMLYLASESIGEKAYYLLTALIKDDDGLTQVMLRVASDKSHGLNGFLNETVAELRHVVNAVQSAQPLYGWDLHGDSRRIIRLDLVRIQHHAEDHRNAAKCRGGSLASAASQGKHQIRVGLVDLGPDQLGARGFQAVLSDFNEETLVGQGCGKSLAGIAVGIDFRRIHDGDLNRTTRSRRGRDEEYQEDQQRLAEPPHAHPAGLVMPGAPRHI